MALPSQPTIELSYSTPFRFQIVAYGPFELEEVTSLTCEVSDLNDFSNIVATSTVTVNSFNYTVPSMYQASVLFVHAKATNVDGDSVWSDAIAVVPQANPLTPIIQVRGSSPQRVAVAVSSNLDTDAAMVTFQFSTANDFADIRQEVVVETGPAVAEYRVPETDRSTLFYARAKAAYIVDFDEEGAERLWESGWSNVISTYPGKIASLDVDSLSADKITSGDLTANLVIGGRIIAGQNPELNDGGYVELKGTGIEWVPKGSTNASVVLPSVGDAVFSGVSVNASKGLDATNSTLRGTGTVADNASITVSAGTVPDPTTAAVTSATWPAQMTIAAGNWTGAAYDSTDTRFWFSRSDGLRSYTTSGTADASITFSSSGAWTTNQISSVYDLFGAAWSTAESQFVAGGTSSGATTAAVIYTSTNGTSWTNRLNSSGTYGFGEINGIGRDESSDQWVAVGREYNSVSQIVGLIYTSSTGTSWTKRTVPSASLSSPPSSARALYCAAKSSTRWVAMGTGKVQSTDGGATWAVMTTPPSGEIEDVVYANSQFVCVGWVSASGPRVFTSSDGMSWTQRTTGVPSTGTLYGITYSAALSLYVAVGNSASRPLVLTSPDGITWTQRTVTGGGSSMRSIAWSPEQSLFVAGGYGDVGLQGGVFTSPDAINWTFRGNLGTQGYLWQTVWSPALTKWLITDRSGYNYTSTTAGVTLSNLTGVATGLGDTSTSRVFTVGDGKLGRVNKTSGTIIQDATVSTYTSQASRVTLFYDNAKIKLVTQDAVGSGGKIQLVAYDPANFATAPTIETLDATFTGNFSFYGAVRFTVSGTDYYAIALTDLAGRTGIYCFNASTGARAAQYDFLDSQGNVPDGGMAYDGTRFYSLATPAATSLQMHSTFHPGTTSQNSYVRYAYANTANTTRVSPAANIALPARAYLSIVIPDLPASASKARVYLRGAASDDTGANSYLKISTGDENLLVYSYGDVDFRTGFDTNVGVIGPWGTVSGNPATIKSGSPGWELSGSGLLTLTERPTNPGAASTDKAFLFLKDNGSGKSQLCIQFATGTPIVIATQV